MVRCGSITPLGRAVDPLVNCSTARLSGSTVGSAKDAVPSSWRTTKGGSPATGSTNGASSASRTSRSASALRTRVRVWDTNSSMEDMRIGNGSTTAVAPASHVAWMAVTRARLVGASRATWAPTPMPRLCRAPAMPQASSWSWDHGTRTGSSSPAMNVMVPPREVACAMRWGRLKEGGLSAI